MKALLLENVHESAVKLLTLRGYDVDTHPGAMSQEEMLDVLPDYDIVGIRSRTTVTKTVIDACERLKTIGAFCIGTNQIDLAAAGAAGIAVFNAPYSNTRSVVEMAVGEIIAMARHLVDQNKKMQQGLWFKSALGSHEIRGRTLGIVGYGNIGAQLSVVAEALGMRVAFYDIQDKLALGNAMRCDTLDELLRISDIVSLHVDGRESNKGFFGEAQFAKMKKGSLFLNLCRGSVVDLIALRDALVSGRIAGASIDVFPREPASSGDEFASVLQGIDNTILTPHIGGSTQEAQEDIGRYVAGKISDYLSFGSTSMSVNLPQVTLARAGVQRILHLHRNIPGVLAKVNAILGDHDVNIEAQQLATRGPLGYVITDVDATEHPGLIGELRALPETVRVSAITWAASDGSYINAPAAANPHDAIEDLSSGDDE